MHMCVCSRVCYVGIRAKWFILLFYRSIGSLSIGELHSSEEGEGYAVTVVVLQRKKSMLDPLHCCCSHHYYFQAYLVG